MSSFIALGWFTRTTQTQAQATFTRRMLTQEERDAHAHCSIQRWRQSCSQNPRYRRPAVGKRGLWERD